MARDQVAVKDDTKKKKKARKAFLLFLKRLRKVCDAANTADEWYGLMQDLTELLQEYTSVIPKGCYDRIEAAMRPVDAVREGFSKPCKVLDYEIERLVKWLPGGWGVGRFVLGGVLTAAVALGAAAAYVQFTAVDVTVFNDGCNTIYLPGMLPIPIPGLSLPDEPIPPGGQATLTLPRMAVDVDATSPGSVSVTVLGISLPYEMSGEVYSIELDGMEILGRWVHADLGSGPEHEFVVRCR